MAIPEKFITELTDRSDIVDVVSGYVRLTKRSGANLFGLCPFHSEKTPSFSVNRDKQIYHCFGCGKGGGVISFIMEIENLSYPEAIAFLARRAGMQMPEGTDSAESRKRARMFALNRDAARFFYAQLSEPAGEAAQAYIRQRGISGAMVKNFGLGAAPDSWEALRRAMREKGYTDQELFDAGLVKRGKSGGFYDAFRNRLMFPVIDVQGRVIGFSGRILGGEGAEGNIDVVSLHQAGFDSAVASLGTALTNEQARLISRYTNEVIIAYDSDGAGLKASQKAIGIFEKLDVKVRILRMSGAKDPDEFIKLKGAEAFRRLIEDSENQLDYQLGRIRSKYDLTVDEQKVDFVREAGELLAKIPDGVRREIYAQRVAETAGIKAEVVTGDVERRHRRLLSAGKKAEQRELTQPEKLVQPAARELRYDDPESAVAEEGLIRLLYLEPALMNMAELPPAEDFSSAALWRIYSVLTARIRSGSAVSADMLAGELEPGEMDLLISLLQKPETLSRSRQSASDYIAKIRERKERREGGTDLRELQKRLRQTKGYEG